MTNDWWGLHDEDDAAAREKGRPKQVDMRRGVELRTCYITTRDGVKVQVHAFSAVFVKTGGRVQNAPLKGPLIYCFARTRFLFFFRGVANLSLYRLWLRGFYHPVVSNV